MIKKIILGLIILNTLAKTDAQNNEFGLFFDFGNSWTTRTINSSDARAFTISNGLGLFALRNIGKKSNLVVDFYWVRMTNRVNRENAELIGGQGVTLGIIDTKSTLVVNYLALPFQYGYRVGKFNLQIGPQISLYRSSVSKYEAEGTVNDEPYQVKNDMNDNTTKTLDVGIRTSFEYSLAKRLGLLLNYYHGVMDVSKSGGRFERKQRRIAIAVKYRITKMVN